MCHLVHSVDVQVDVEERAGLAAVSHVAAVVRGGEVEQEPAKEAMLDGRS